MAGLNNAVRELAEFEPVEDVVLPLLRPKLGGIDVVTLYRPDQNFPVVLVRRGDSFGNWESDGEARFVDSAYVIIDCLVEDPDGDQDAAVLGEAVRVALRNAWLTSEVVPGKGHISKFEMKSSPRRSPDWATSVGPVQYADLPSGVHRYEARYQLGVRRATN